jgi:predicted phage baseplate assembly protein
VSVTNVPPSADATLDEFSILRSVTLSEEVIYADFPNEIPVTTVFGNVVDADEGKTLPEVPIGSGNATLIFQNFKIPKPPLTYHIVPENTPSETPELEIYVDGRKWAQVDSFFGCGKHEQVYIVREDADGNSWAQFGDGKTGVRLTSGVNNVTALYRVGDGAYGPLKDDTKVQASAKLKNLAKIGMPSDATGGAPPEDGENARNAAPGKVQSLGRIVSLKDFEAEAAAIPGVASASAAWQLVDNVPAVVVTVLMETGRSTEIAAVRDTLNSYNTQRGAGRHAIDVVLGKRMYAAVSVEYALKPTYRADLVEPAIRRALGVNYAKATRDEDQTGLFSLRRRRFGGREYASSIAGTVQNVEGVLWARTVAFTALSDSDDPQTITLPTTTVLDPIVSCDSGHVLSLYDKHLLLSALKEEGS